MFADIQHAMTLLKQGSDSGGFLLGDYSIAASDVVGVDFEPSSMDKKHAGGVDDQSIVNALQQADKARQSVADDINDGFGQIDDPADTA